MAILLLAAGTGCAAAPEVVDKRDEPQPEQAAPPATNSVTGVVSDQDINPGENSAKAKNKVPGETAATVARGVPAGTKPAPTANTQLQRVKKLIEESSAAQQVAKSEVRAAHAKREEARQLYGQAQQAGESGRTEEMKQLLKGATSTMFEAVRLAGRKEVVAENEERRFRTRLESVKVLMEANSRISGEKGSSSSDRALSKRLQPDLLKAEKLAEQGDFLQAGQLVDSIYNEVKKSVRGLREGDTLVRELSFESEKEEYDYELDRNDTHKMLVNILLKEKLEAKPGLAKKIAPYIKKAQEVRDVAEQLAQAGEHGRAIKKLEESTKHLVRAIRGAGVYIPG